MKHWILLAAVFAVSMVTSVKGSCQSDVNGCTTTFQLKLYKDSAAVCSSLNEFVQCTYTVLQPCSIDTRTLLQTGIQFLINQYTQPPNNCVVEDVGNYTVDKCTEEISYCAAYNFNGLDSTDDIEQACRYFHIYLQCMSTNTTSCSKDEEVEIQTAIQNSVKKFRKCPYGCDTNIECETKVCYSTVTQLITDTAAMYTMDTMTSSDLISVVDSTLMHSKPQLESSESADFLMSSQSEIMTPSFTAWSGSQTSFELDTIISHTDTKWSENVDVSWSGVLLPSDITTSVPYIIFPSRSYRTFVITVNCSETTPTISPSTTTTTSFETTATVTETFTTTTQQKETTPVVTTRKPQRETTRAVQVTKFPTPHYDDAAEIQASCKLVFVISVLLFVLGVL